MSEYQALLERIQEGDFAGVQKAVREFLAQGRRPEEVIQKGIVPALDIVGEKFSRGEAFIPEMLIAAKASQKGLEILKPLLAKGDFQPKGKVVIGTVKGDLHDIGKNIVGMMLESAGFQVFDLGFDVGPEKFVNALKAESAQILAMSCLLTTTMMSVKDTLEALRAAGLYGKVRVMIGGPPTSEAYARQIGADFWGKDAYDAVQQARIYAGAK
jgi:5-methyltetrahydrofolate--homocysteine methyltransferase